MDAVWIGAFFGAAAFRATFLVGIAVSVFGSSGA